ncbi:DUF1801 domain-containing protein [Alteromonas oceanisediminis]|uniref:DUF1801 domain-containing protein n=1 Tax=Alteromonas oceanisediminis TaxID=2836180 RepID=UPI001BDA107D|nr:DUF1801 domain-containing protein [Alteromonas oceanisediminis]MBT0587810.1 DUF1801 domain-containing protein [Alteromonas oceanisediminis]
MSQNKTQPTTQQVKQFIEGVENEKRRDDAKTLLRIYHDVTKMEPVMWGPSIIGYGQYHYTTANGKKHKFLRTGFSPRKSNLSIYLMKGMEEAKKAELLSQLGKHKTGKSCLYINKLDDVNLNVLEALITLDFEQMNATYPS